jgi:hypothetical protein
LTVAAEGGGGGAGALWRVGPEADVDFEVLGGGRVRGGTRHMKIFVSHYFITGSHIIGQVLREVDGRRSKDYALTGSSYKVIHRI